MVQNELQESVGQVTQAAEAVSIGKQTSLLDKLQISRALLFDVALFAGIGFLAGFLMRRFASYLIAFVLFCIGLLIAQEMGIVIFQINTQQIFHLVGVQQSFPVSHELLVPFLIEWARTNIIVAIGGIIGFLLGLQAG